MLFIVGLLAILSAIIQDKENKSNVAFKVLRVIQDIAFSVTHPVTIKETEWKESVMCPLSALVD